MPALCMTNPSFPALVLCCCLPALACLPHSCCPAALPLYLLNCSCASQSAAALRARAPSCSAGSSSQVGWRALPAEHTRMPACRSACNACRRPLARVPAGRRRNFITLANLPACLPPSLLPGSKLLERYGMTETGMLLGNPYHGERRPETVGQPFPGVQVRITHPDGSDAGSGG